MYDKFSTQCILFWLTLGWAVFPNVAEASHFRAGTMTYKYISGNTIEVTLEIFQRRGYHCENVQPSGKCCSGTCLNKTLSGFSKPIVWGDSNKNTKFSEMQVFSEDKANDALGFRKTFRHTYSKAGTFTITWGGCCRISGIKPSITSYKLELKAKVGSANSSPTFQSPTLFNGCANIPIARSLNPSDPDKDSVTVSHVKRTGGASSAGLSIDSKGFIKWNSPVPGKWVVSVKATDSKGAEAYRDFLLDIKTTSACTNKPPKMTLSVTKTNAAVGQKVCTKITVTDPDTANRFLMQVTPSLPGATFNPNSVLTPGRPNPFNFEYCWTPTAAYANTTQNILFTATDSGTPTLSVQGTFTVKVGPAPTPPKITLLPNQKSLQVNEGSKVSWTATASDADSSIASFKVTGQPSFCKVTSPKPNQRKIECSPDYTVGTKSFAIKLEATDKDATPKTTRLTLTLNVKDVNRQPTIQNPGNQTWKDRTPQTLQIQASDPDNDTLTYTLKTSKQGSSPPQTAGATISKAGLISWTPQRSDLGRYDFTVTVSDGKQGKASVTFVVTVTSSNRPPSISSKPPSVAYVGRLFVYSPKATDPDAGDKLTWKLKLKPTKAQINTQTGQIQWTPEPSNANQTKTFELQVCDDSNACSSSQIFSVNVQWIPCKVDVECPGKFVCLLQGCTPPGCYNKTPSCSSTNELCTETQCIKNNCAPGGSLQCTGNKFCRPGSPQCIGSCAIVRCPAGEICEDGICAKDLCNNVNCKAGEICIIGKCEVDRCAASNVCKFGRVCSTKQNRCIDAPCRGVQCPPKQVCGPNGQCILPPECKCDNDCPDRSICVAGKCRISNCVNATACQTGEVCSNGRCKTNPCLNKKCGPHQFCRAGQCVPSCAGVFCKDNEICVDGKCSTNPCHEKKCNTNEVCANGKCIEDRCSNKQCSCASNRTCQHTKCIDDPCKDIACPTGETCQNGQCIGDRTCKSDRDCLGESICVNKVCQREGCYKQTCDSGSICIDGTCKANPCDGKNCRDDEACRPLDGQCVPKCPYCPQGKICRGSNCEEDPCANKTCPKGQVCDAQGQCVADLCDAKGGDPLCRYRRICVKGTCQDDPCLKVSCPSDSTCKQGVCLTTTPPPEPEPEPEPKPEPEPEPTPEPDASAPEYKIYGGGCDCNTLPSPSPLFWLLPFAILLWILRRR